MKPGWYGLWLLTADGTAPGWVLAVDGGGPILAYPSHEAAMEGAEHHWHFYGIRCTPKPLTVEAAAEEMEARC